MAATGRADWLIPTGLIALALIPVVAGVVRLTLLAAGGPLTAENARFFGAPVPVVLHIISVTIYSLLGAFQFAPGFRRRRPDWHRAAGRVVAIAGLGTATSGIWMASSYAIVPADSALLHGFRLFFGWAMVLAIALGVVAILRKDVAAHQAWMRRAYAIGLGAGTQALIQIPPLVLVGEPNDMSRALMMGAGWVVNVVVVEWLIRARSRRPLSLVPKHRFDTIDHRR
jgi:uncharacterized membrane protein